jgi:hypothetical protein
LLVHDTWASRDLPVLDATVALLEQSFMVTVTDIAARTNLAASVVAASLEALDPVYVDFRKTTTGGDPRYWYVFKVTPAARRVVGQWPTAESLASRLAEELAAAARDESEAERQSLLTYAARLIGETLRDATVRAAGRVLGPAFGGVPAPELGVPVQPLEPALDDDYPSLVELPELPELLRSRTAEIGAVADPDPAEPGQSVEPDQSPEADQPAEPDQSAEPGQPLPVEVPEAQQLEPLPEPDSHVSEPAAVAEPPSASASPSD